MRVALLALLCAGCSVLYDLETYDQTTSTSSSGSTSTSSAGGSGGEGGQGGQLDCGDFVNPPVSSVVETFDTGLGALAPHGGCTFADAGSVLFDLPALPALDYCWLSFPGVYHLTCDSLTFRLLEATNPIFGAQTYVYLDDLTTGASANLILESGGFSFGLTDGSASMEISNAFYNPNADRYLRIRADQTTMYFDIHNGTEWQTRGSSPHLLPLDNLRVRVGAGSHRGIQAAPGQARIDCINVFPCP